MLPSCVIGITVNTNFTDDPSFSIVIIIAMERMVSVLVAVGTLFSQILLPFVIISD